MNKRLQKIWARLGCKVVSRFGRDRRITKNGITIISGGYQRELDYLITRHPQEINNG